jgi:hypothetical protein
MTARFVVWSEAINTLRISALAVLFAVNAE